MYGERPGERLTDAQRARLQLWLRRRGRITVELEAMTPLVEARYFARYRAHRVVRGMAYLATALVAAWIVLEPFSGIVVRGTTTGLSVFVAFFTAVYALFLTVLWYQRRADRRIAAALRQRAARSHAVDLRAVFGGRFVEATYAIYGAGLLFAGVAGSLATQAQDRVLSLVFVIGVLICAGLGAGVLADVVRRPAIAEDDRSLAADDTMRREDAWEVVLPPLAGLAVLAANVSDSPWLVLGFYGYGGVVTGTAVVWWRASVRVRRAAGVALRSVPS